MTLLPKPTFSSITRGLRKTISQLEKLVITNNTTSVKFHKVISEHVAKIGDLDTEASRAGATAGKLRELIGE